MSRRIRGKSVNLFLMDGEATGRIKATMANWTGLAYRIPRTLLEKCRDREDLKQNGVYFLFGTSDVTGGNVVYVGQAGSRKNGEGLLTRLFEHKRDASKDYWTEAIVFTTSNNTFGPTEISYLENRFCNMAIDANRYEVKNGNDPSPGNVTEEKESELEEYIDNAKILMGALGHKVFEPVITAESDTEKIYDGEDEPILYLHRKDAMGKGQRTSEGFVVLKGSVITAETTASCPDHILRYRENAFLKNLINDDNTLTEDILLGSPSAAAGFVGGASLNGNVMWKTSEGVKLGDLE